MGCLEIEKPLFVVSNLGTRFVVSVCPDTTVVILKDKLACEHFSCFPTLGEIKVQKVMVKRKSCLYHLPDTMLVKFAFHGFLGSWFLHVEISNSQAAKEIMNPSKIQENKVRGTLSQAELLRRTLYTPLVSNMSALCQSISIQDQSKEIISTQNRPSQTNISVSNACDATEYSQLNNCMKATNHSDKRRRDHYGCEEGEKKMPFVSPRKKKKLKWDKCTNCMVDESLTENAATNDASIIGTSRLELPNHDVNKQKEDNGNCELQCAGETDRKKSPMHIKSWRCRPSSETAATPSISLTEETNVTGIISRYFSEFDEVNSCSSSQHKCTTETKKFHADGSSKGLCSSIAHKRMKKAKKTNIHTYQEAVQNDSLNTKVNKEEDLVNGDRINMTPTSNVGILCHVHSHFSKNISMSGSVNGAKEVGRRIIRAAHSIGASVGKRKSPISGLKLRCGKFLSSNSNVPVRHFGLQLDDYIDC